MRCQCCNKMLSDYEATRRCVTTNDFLDICNVCYSTIAVEVQTVDRPDLRHKDQLEEGEEGEEFHDVIKEDFLTMWNDKS